MNSFITSDEFDDWLDKLRDERGKSHILDRITKVQRGNFSHSKSVGDRVFEMRVYTGPGYRIYYTRGENTVYWLLNGGDK